MQKDAEPSAQLSPSVVFVTSLSPPAVQQGLPAPHPWQCLPFSSFHDNLFILSTHIKGSLCCAGERGTPSSARGSHIWVAALLSGGRWAGRCLPAAVSPTCALAPLPPHAPLPPGSEDRLWLHRLLGRLGDTALASCGIPTPSLPEPPWASSGSAQGAGPPRLDCG